MSGGSPRSAEMKRSNSRSISVGIDAVMPRQKQTALLAAEPRPWQRIAVLRAGEADDVVDGEEVGRVVELRDQCQLLDERARCTLSGTPPG